MQTQIFCYVDDLVEGFVRFMDLPGSKGEPGYPGPINLGNPHEFTIMELAERVVSLTGSKSKIVKKPLPADDPMQRQPNIERAKAYLNGWEPAVQLDEGLRHTIAYFDGLLSRV